MDFKPQDTRQKSSNREEMQFHNNFANCRPMPVQNNDTGDMFDRSIFNKSFNKPAQSNTTYQNRLLDSTFIIQQQQNDKQSYLNNNINTGLNNFRPNETRIKRAENENFPRNDIFMQNNYQKDLETKNGFFGFMPQDTRKEKVEYSANELRENKSYGLPSEKLN